MLSAWQPARMSYVLAPGPRPRPGNHVYIAEALLDWSPRSDAPVALRVVAVPAVQRDLRRAARVVAGRRRAAGRGGCRGLGRGRQRLAGRQALQRGRALAWQ